MPPPGRRRPRPSLAAALGNAGEPQPEWFLRRREEGWNGRFASDGPSYFDVPSAIGIGGEGSRMGRDVGRIRGGDGVGVAGRRSGTLAGKRARVRTNMTPSLSRGGVRGGVSSSGASGNTPDLYLMEKIYPDDPGPLSTVKRGSEVRAPPKPPPHQGGWGLGMQREGSLPARNAAGSSSNGVRERKGSGAYRGVALVKGSVVVVDRCVSQVDARVLVAATRAATGACMYREQLLVRLHALVDDWPKRSPDHLEAQMQHQANKQERDNSGKKRRVRVVAKTTRGGTTVQGGSGERGGREKAESSTDITLSQSGSGGSTTVASSVTGRSGESINRRRIVAKTGVEGQTGAMLSETARAVAERRPRAARNLTYIAGEIKKAGLSCVERIVAWSLVVSPETCRPTPFRWSSQDYLAKMHTDLDFVSKALGRDAPSFGRGNPLLLTRSEAAGQPRAGQVGRYYAATYVILDAVNRARDAAAAASATSVQVEEGSHLPSQEPSSVDRLTCEEGKFDVGSDGGRANGGGDGSYMNLGGGGLGVIVVASDGSSLGTIGDPPSPASVPRQPKSEDQANPDTGGVLERGTDWSAAPEGLLEEGAPETYAENNEASRIDVCTQYHGLNVILPAIRTTAAARIATTVDLHFLQDLSDGYGESFEEFEEDDVVGNPPAVGAKQQLHHETSEAQRFREKAERMLRENEEDERMQESSSRLPSHKDEIQLPDDGNRGSRLSKPDVTEIQQAEGQRVRGEESERMQDVDRRKERDLAAEQHLRQAEQGDLKGGLHQQRLREEAEKQKIREAERQRLRDEEVERVQIGEQQKAREEEEERLRSEEMAAEEERCRDQRSLRETEAEAQRQKQSAEEAELQRVRGEEAAPRVWDDHDVKERAEMENGGVDDRQPKSGDLPSRIGEYDVESLLGDGAYGWVYKCRKRERPGRSGAGNFAQSDNCNSDKQDEISAVVAIKQFKGLTDMEDEHTKNYVRLTQQREAQLALSLLHPNIVRCLGTLTNGEAFGPSGAGTLHAGVGDDGDRGGGIGGSCASGGRASEEVAFLVFEHVPGTLLDLIQERPGGLPLPMTVSLLQQLLSAVGFLHQHDVVHRDVKPENILVHRGNGCDGAPVLKLCDLGTARKAGEMMGVAGATATTTSSALRIWTEYVGSRWYRAPEMLAGSTEYGPGVDVWACACLAAEMSSGRPLFPGEDEGELAISMAELLGPLPPDLASRLREMGYTPPPPRGRPTRLLEACLDGSTGDHEVRRINKGSSRASRADDGAGVDVPEKQSSAQNQIELNAALLEVLGSMLAFDPASRPSAQECLLHADVFGGGSSAADASFPGADTDEGIDFSKGLVSSGASAAEGSRCSCSTLTKEAGSEPTTGAVVGGGSGESDKIGSGGLGIKGHIQATVEGSEIVSDLGDGQEELDTSILEMEADKEGRVSDAVDDGEDEEDDGGYDDEEYDEDDADGVEECDASLVGSPRADHTVADEGDTADRKSPTKREPSPSRPPPPVETAFLGEEGYVRKRVVEIEQKEEFYNPGKQERTAFEDGLKEEQMKGDAPHGRLPSEAPLREGCTAAAAFETANADTSTVNAAPMLTSTWEDSGNDPTSSDGSNMRQTRDADASSNPSSYAAFDAAAAASAAATLATAVAVADHTIHAALVQNSRMQGDGGNDRPNRLQRYLKADSSGDDGYFSAEEEENGDKGPRTPEPDRTVALGDEAYDSESFDGAEDEAEGGALLDIGGRTSFFPDSSQIHSTAEDKMQASKEPQHGSSIVADFDAAATGGVQVAISQNSVSATGDTGEPRSTLGKMERPKGVEEGNPFSTPALRLAAAGPDEGAEGGDGADDDGWRVAGAFRVLSASGPGGEFAARAAKGLLRRRNQRGRQQQGKGIPGSSGRRHGDVDDVNALFRQALNASGVKEGHARRSMEGAFATGSPPQEATNATGVGQPMGGGAASVRKALEVFAVTAVAVDGEGLSTQRLVLLTTGLAQCIDTEFREKAEKCQAWATQARQGKRPFGRGDDSPLRECAEYLSGDHGKNGIVVADVGEKGGGADGEVGNVCASFLVALCEAVSRGRPSGTIDAVHAASRLQALSRAVCSLSPFVLDSDRPKAEREEDLVGVAVSMGVDDGLARQILLQSVPLSSCLLSPAGQAVLLRAALCGGGERRVNIVTTRKEALDQIEKALQSELEVAEETGSRSTTRISTADGGRSPSHVTATAALVLNPYYLSPWGKKRVMGKRVEEGEGLGPRKELFELAARQLSERWRSPPSLLPSPLSPAVGPSPVVTGTAREGTAEVDLVIHAEPPSSSERADAAPSSAFSFLVRIKAGWKIKVQGQTRTLESVEQEQHSDGSIRCSARVTRLWMDGFQSEEIEVEEACRPVLVYQQGSESNWLDATADRSNTDHRARLRTLGALLALSVTNACRLPVELPDLFFRWLLLGGKAGTVERPHSFQPSVKDMVTLDQSLARPFEALKDAVQSKGALEGLLEIEGLPSETPAEDYIAHMVRQTFLDPVEWQVSEIRTAFFRALPPPPRPQGKGVRGFNGTESARLLQLLPRPTVLAEIIRGRSPLCGDCSYGGRDDGRGLSFGAGDSGEEAPRNSNRRQIAKDFDFREVFLVHEDQDLVACSPLREGFWSVVHSELSAEERRLLLLFITGTDRLPEAGCETLSIEILFEPPGGGKGNESSEMVARKALGQVPTAHTCDNVLELPNYWAILMRVDGIGKTPPSAISAEDRQRLETRLREVLASRLRIALNNASGYALDDLDDDSDAGHTTEGYSKDGGGSVRVTDQTHPERQPDRGTGDGRTVERGEEEELLEIPSLDDDRRSNEEVAIAQSKRKPNPGGVQEVVTLHAVDNGTSENQGGRRGRTYSREIAGGVEDGERRTSLSTSGFSDGEASEPKTEEGGSASAVDLSQNRGHRHRGSGGQGFATKQAENDSRRSSGDGKGKVTEATGGGESGVGGDGGYFDDDSIDFDIDDLEDLEM
ncbi:unnamed protein product [Scytosiphon promiscuus]